MTQSNGQKGKPVQTNPPKRSNPYVGPRPFLPGEELFGRDREIRGLFDQLLAERIVLLHSPSGAGKTSLINAGLLPMLQEDGLIVLPVVRVGEEPDEEYTRLDGFNRYIYSMMISLDGEIGGSPPAQGNSGEGKVSIEISQAEGDTQRKARLDELASMPLKAYLDRRRQMLDTDLNVIIFDQFEEIITTAPTDLASKQDFFNQVGTVLRDRSLWALFVIRDDFLGALEPFTLSIPTQFTNTFRLDLLSKTAARQAIQKPVASRGITFLDSAAERLVDDLRLVQTQAPSGEIVSQKGNHVEPVQLQVVCLRLYNQLDLANRLDKVEINDEDIKDVGDVGTALANYYAERVADIAGSRNIERKLRDWFDWQLITKSGLRSQVMMEVDASGGLDNNIIRQLGKAHLVRAEKRRGVTWFELAHDRLIEPVQKDNARWRRQHLRSWQLRAIDWNENGQKDGLLLRGDNLERAKAWADNNPADLNELDRKYLQSSIKWRETHLSPLQRRAAEWETQDRPQNLLFSGSDLEQASDWAMANTDEITSRELEFLEASRAAHQEELRRQREQAIQLEFERQRADEQAETATRLRRRALALGIATVAAIIMFSVALFFANRAIKTSNTNATLAAENAAFGNAQAAIAAEKDALAQTRSTQAAENAAIAKEQSNLAAERQIQAAVNAQIALTSIAAEALAQSREATAVYNEQLAFSRQLASQSLSFLERKTDLGTLLSIAAYQVDPSTWESRHALLTSLQTGLDQSVQPYAVMIPSTMEITNNVDISPDGKTIAWSGSDGRVVLWDVAQKKTLKELQDPSGEKITAQAFSPTDPNLLVTGSENNTITFWDLSDDSFERIEIIIVDGEERYKLNRIRFLTFNKTGDQLAVHGQNRIISIWDVATRTQIKSFADPTGADFFWQLAWSPDGNYIAAAGADNYLYIFDPQSGRAIDYARNPGREGEIYTLGWSSDSKLLAFTGRTGSQLASVYFYEIASTSVLSDYIETPASAIFSLASSFDDRLMVFAGRNEPVYVWDTSENVELARLTEYGQFQNGVSFVKNLLAYIGKNTISVYEMSVPEPLSSELPSATREVLSLSTDPQGALWIASLSGRDILLQGRSDGESQTYRLGTDLPSSSSPIHLQFTPEGLMLFVTDQAGDIYQWDPSNGQSNLVLSGLTTPLTAMAISPAGNMLAVSYCAEPTADQPEEVCTSQIQLWDLSNLSTLGQPIPTSQGIITSLIFSQDGSSLASGSQEGTILLIDTVSGKQIGLPLGDFSVNISSLAYSPDGVILAAGTDDGQLFLWDVNTGQILGKPFHVGNDRLAGLAYAQDGLTMYSATANGQLTAWDMDLNSWKERACRIAGRDFTPEETGNYFPGRKYKSICPEFAQATATPTP